MEPRAPTHRRRKGLEAIEAPQRRPGLPAGVMAAAGRSRDQRRGIGDDPDARLFGRGLAREAMSCCGCRTNCADMFPRMAAGPLSRPAQSARGVAHAVECARARIMKPSGAGAWPGSGPLRLDDSGRRFEMAGAPGSASAEDVRRAVAHGLVPPGRPSRRAAASPQLRPVLTRGGLSAPAGFRFRPVTASRFAPGRIIRIVERADPQLGRDRRAGR